MYDKMTPSAVTAPATQPRRHPSEAMASLRIVTHAVSSPCDKFASLYLPLEASDSVGSGEDYHISSWRKGWTRMLVVRTAVISRGSMNVPAYSGARCPLLSPTERKHSVMSRHRMAGA